MFISNDFPSLFIVILIIKILINDYVLLQNVTESRTCQNVGKAMQTELLSLTCRNSIHILYGYVLGHSVLFAHYISQAVTLRIWKEH